jgi:hypothetical protein
MAAVSAIRRVRRFSMAGGSVTPQSEAVGEVAVQGA